MDEIWTRISCFRNVYDNIKLYVSVASFLIDDFVLCQSYMYEFTALLSEIIWATSHKKGP